MKATILKTGAMNRADPLFGGRGFRLPGGKGGIILLVVVIFASYYGVDLTGLITGEPVDNSSQQRSISPQEDEAAKFTSVIFATTEDTGATFRENGAPLPATQTGDVP